MPRLAAGLGAGPDRDRADRRARYNHTIVQTHFSQAVHIVDLFHAYEHLTAIAQILWGPEAKAPKAWRDWLEAGDIRLLLQQYVTERGHQT